LDNLSKIRNVVAHHYEWSIRDNGVKRLIKNNEALSLVSNFPHTLDKEVERAISRLARLQFTKERKNKK
jgi:hypothetical protein